MGGAGFLLAINLGVAGLFAAAFLMVMARRPENVPARWFAGVFLLGFANYVAEWSIPSFQRALPAGLAAFSLSVAALVCLAGGLAARFREKTDYGVLAFLFVASVVLFLGIYEMPRSSTLRQIAYQTPYAGIQAYAAWLVIAGSRKTRYEMALGLLLAATGLHFITKPLIAAAVGGIGATPQDYIGTVYALYSQSAAAILIVATGLMLIGLLVRDMMTAMVRQSETDLLSGLLNRRGFETHGQAVMQAMARTGVPVVLVIADIDEFKAVNDTFGHAAGDRVIEGFSRLLHEAASTHHIVGRIGGEEFAVLLAGADLPAARLFAEGVRSAFRYLSVAGLPADRKLSASFGLAVMERDEHLGELMQRADRALYAAKKAGRDCVRAAPLERRLYRDASAETADVSVARR